MSEITTPTPQEQTKKTKPVLTYQYYSQQQVVFAQTGHSGKRLQVLINEEPFGEPVEIVDEIVIVHGPYVLPKTGISVSWNFV